MELDATSLEIAGLSVVVTAFDDETGWESTSKNWHQSRSEGPFATVIAEVRGVPAEECERIAEETLEQWRARGGETADRGDGWKVISILGTTFGLACVGALALLGFVVWLLIDWL